MKTQSLIIVFIICFRCHINAQVPDSIKYTSLRPHEFQAVYLKEEKAILIDVREFFEYRKSRLKDAVNIPSSANLALYADTLDKKCALFLYCTSGVRSKRVAKRFFDKGFYKLYSLEGGIVAWKKEGMTVIRKKIRR
jgi:rhodanese-related sulfurtransferase